MDRVRFGRALGMGARHAVKTLVAAADAASAENPSGKAAPPRASTPPTAQGAQPAPRPAPARRATVASTVARTSTQAGELTQGVKRGGKRFGEAVWSPVVRLSGVLWLEVTGVYFGILALFAGQGVWKARGEWHGGAPHQHLLGAAAMLALFGYFCVSSFVRAHRRERRR